MRLRALPEVSDDIANLIEEAIEHRADAEKISAIRDHVRKITARFPLPF